MHPAELVTAVRPPACEIAAPFCFISKVLWMQLMPVLLTAVQYYRLALQLYQKQMKRSSGTLQFSPLPLSSFRKNLYSCQYSSCTIEHFRAFGVLTLFWRQLVILPCFVPEPHHPAFALMPSCLNWFLVEAGPWREISFAWKRWQRLDGNWSATSHWILVHRSIIVTINHHISQLNPLLSKCC